jgi:hypothetical protein
VVLFLLLGTKNSPVLKEANSEADFQLFENGWPKTVGKRMFPIRSPLPLPPSKKKKNVFEPKCLLLFFSSTTDSLHLVCLPLAITHHPSKSYYLLKIVLSIVVQAQATKESRKKRGGQGCSQDSS